MAAAAAVGYSPSQLARALVARSSRMIGVVVGDIVDSYFAEITRGVDDVAAKAGFLTMVSNADRSTAAEIAHLRVLREYHAAGVVFAGSGFRDDEAGGELTEAVTAAREAGVEVVSLAPRELPTPRILVDNRAAAYDLTAYLISLGHRRIAFIEGPAGLHTSLLRLEGFQAAMTAAGLDADLRQEGGFDHESGYAAMLRMMADGALPDAVVGANDEAAIGALMALRQARVEVPGRVSVAGMDDTRPARFLDLTTMSLPLYELGVLAARRILADEGERAREPFETVLPHRLVPRSTTARRRAGRTNGNGQT